MSIRMQVFDILKYINGIVIYRNSTKVVKEIWKVYQIGNDIFLGEFIEMLRKQVNQKTIKEVRYIIEMDESKDKYDKEKIVKLLLER